MKHKINLVYSFTYFSFMIPRKEFFEKCALDTLKNRLQEDI